MRDQLPKPGRRRRKPPVEFWLWLGIIGLVVIFGSYLVMGPLPIWGPQPTTLLERR